MSEISQFILAAITIITWIGFVILCNDVSHLKRDQRTAIEKQDQLIKLLETQAKKGAYIDGLVYEIKEILKAKNN